MGYEKFHSPLWGSSKKSGPLFGVGEGKRSICEKMGTAQSIRTLIENDVTKGKLPI